MFQDLKPYDAYCAPSSPWIPAFPREWMVAPGAGVLSEVRDRNDGLRETTVLSLSYGRVVVKPSDKLHGLVPASFETYQILEPGDIVFRPTDLQNDQKSLRVGAVEARGIITSAYIGLRPRGIDPRFAFLYLSALDHLKVFYGMGSGLRQNIDFRNFKRLPIPVPSEAEQAAIVTYLAHANQRISRAIAAKRRLISLFNEQKRAVTSEAMRGALTSTAGLVDSGVQHIGRIPSHWRVDRLGWHIDLLAGFPFESSGFVTGGDGVRLLRGVNVGVDGVVWNDTVAWPTETLNGTSAFSLAEGDLVLGLDRPVIRAGVRIARIAAADVPSLLVQRVARLRARSSLDREFLRLVLADRGFTDYLAPIFTGISVPHLSPTQVRDFRVAIPPIDEQREIVTHIAEAHLRLDSAREVARQEIRLLEEFRVRLAADVVTGQIDVRPIAAELPAIEIAEMFSASVGTEGADDADDGETADDDEMEEE